MLAKAMVRSEGGSQRPEVESDFRPLASAVRFPSSTGDAMLLPGLFVAGNSHVQDISGLSRILQENGLSQKPRCARAGCKKMESAGLQNPLSINGLSRNTRVHWGKLGFRQPRSWPSLATSRAFGLWTLDFELNFCYLQCE